MSEGKEAEGWDEGLCIHVLSGGPSEGSRDGEARRECLERKACSRGRRDADLAVRRIAKQLPLGVLHGTGDGAVHEPGDSELGHVQFAFQHCVLDQGETGRPGAKMEATASA